MSREEKKCDLLVMVVESFALMEKEKATLCLI